MYIGSYKKIEKIEIILKEVIEKRKKMCLQKFNVNSVHGSIQYLKNLAGAEAVEPPIVVTVQRKNYKDDFGFVHNLLVYPKNECLLMYTILRTTYFLKHDVFNFWNRKIF